MALQRCLLPTNCSPPTLLRAAATLLPRSCPQTPRSFTPSLNSSSSSKRKLVTTTAYRPHSLDLPPPPRSSTDVETSISAIIPQVNETRPPQQTEQKPQQKASATSSVGISVAIPEAEAQKSQPVAPVPQQAAVPEQAIAPAPSKPRRKLKARKAAMNLTPSAISHLRDLLAQPEPKLIRVGVKNRGCSGLAYHLEYVEKPGTFDEQVEQEGVKVLIDSKALFSIIGSEMDWVEDKLNERFVFRNPNIKEQCGCGESFTV